MIIQGSNNPLVVEFTDSVAEMPALVVTLWRDKTGAEPTLVKEWQKADMMVSGDGKSVVCEISDEETAALCPVPHVVEAKGLDAEGKTVFWSACRVDILTRRDKAVILQRVV